MTRSTASVPSLTFLGDLVAPEWRVPHLTGFREWLGDSVPVANLEGPIVDDFARARPRSRVKFNLASAPLVLDRLGPGPAVVTIANNHYEDFDETHLPDRGRANIRVIGDRHGTVSTWSVGGRAVALVGLSLPATDPLRWRKLRRIATGAPSRMLRLLEMARSRHRDAFLIAVVHWGYEYSLLPFPADRAWARRAFDVGVDMIIGHHPHVIQPIERIGGKTVAYSLGNFFLPDGDYFGKALKLPATCRYGLAARFDGATLTPFVIEPDPAQGDVAIRSLAEIGPDPTVAAFAGQTDREYLEYFRQRRRAGGARVPAGIPTLKDYSPGEAALLFWQDARQFARNGLLQLGLRNPYGRRAG